MSLPNPKELLECTRLCIKIHDFLESSEGEDEASREERRELEELREWLEVRA